MTTLREAAPEPVMEFRGRRLTPEGTHECWGVLLCKPEQDPPRGTNLYAVPTTHTRQWWHVLPGGRVTDKWESARVGDFNRGWNEYRKAAHSNLEALHAAPPAAPEPVALESVHLTRDTRGMCVVRVNGRVAIRDNGDIIDHMATLEWFAAPPAAPDHLRDATEMVAPAQPAVPLTDEQIDAIRANCWSHPGLGASFDYDKFARAIERAHGIGGRK